MTRQGAGIVAGAAILTLAGCMSFGALTPVTPISVDAGRTASVVSAFRAANGRGRVGIDSRLMQVAEDQARAIGGRGRISHTVAGSLARRVSNAGYDWGATAENLGAGYPDIDAAMAGWKASAGHRRNLLNRRRDRHRHRGCRYAPGSKHRNYWALVLAGPRQERLAAGGPFSNRAWV